MIYGYGLGTSFARDTGEGFVQDASGLRNEAGLRSGCEPQHLR